MPSLSDRDGGSKSGVILSLANNRLTCGALHEPAPLGVGMDRSFNTAAISRSDCAPVLRASLIVAAKSCARVLAFSIRQARPMAMASAVSFDPRKPPNFFAAGLSRGERVLGPLGNKSGFQLCHGRHLLEHEPAGTRGAAERSSCDLAGYPQACEPLELVPVEPGSVRPGAALGRRQSRLQRSPAIACGRAGRAYSAMPWQSPCLVVLQTLSCPFVRGRRKALPFSKTTFELTNHSAQIPRGISRCPLYKARRRQPAGLLLCDGNAVTDRNAVICRFDAS